jgi:hypothetical protein
VQIYADKIVHPESDSVLEALPGEWSRRHAVTPAGHLAADTE